MLKNIKMDIGSIVLSIANLLQPASKAVFGNEVPHNSTKSVKLFKLTLF